MPRSEASLMRDPLFGVDSRWSWITAGFLGWVLCGVMMGRQAAGVVFYGIIETFGVTRKQASWPLVVSGSLLSIGAPFMGYLCRRFSCRAVLLVCPAVAAVSVCLCYLADGVLFLTIFFGLIHGMALSGAFVAVNVLVSQHFDKRRATACSVIFTLTGLNLLYIPPLAEMLRATYGIRGALLLLGGVMLNSCPAVIILRSPVWMERPDSSPAVEDVQLVKKSVSKAGPSLLGPDTLQEESASEEERTSQQSLWKAVVAKARSFQDLVASCVRTQSPRPAERDSQSFVHALKLFATVPFVVNALSFSVVIFGLTTFVLLHVDLGTDRGLPPERAVLLLNAFAVGDLVVRPLSGIIIDSGLLSLDVVMLLGYIIQGCAFELFVWLDSFPLMLACSTLVGVSNGSRVALQAPALAIDFGIDALPLLMGGLVFATGLVHFTRPFLFGYFRDLHGSYDGILHVVAGLNAAFVVLWTLKVIARKRQRSSCTAMEAVKEPVQC
ncbi:hypothetical protein V5799_023561 [Amblyomma americanum]|uniref:Monocarboxylate transporter n=1 Tax=Amblyomma americanum TaxID=6943 RepID=A0AAQ4FI47_AMBAM